MIQFSKLRLHGFKSFVDKTELEIGPGLTGIVGPNGCGKSNLVEALRWSMGENSSKRMRGGSGSMEDVIFNGTENRPARNVAEVTLLLENKDHSAPNPWNTTEEIEVLRKIERDHGSTYKINGKTMRARDVQLLYADIMSGANSPFLVSQGKVTNLINAKPAERRLVLEEAAGITGLYARRHEAELRLRATDNNLKRLEDLVGSMDSRLQALKKQARQALRYRNLSAQIRQLEVMISTMDWKRAHQKLREVEQAFGIAESAVAERMTVVSQLTRTQNVQSADLPELRQQEAEMSAALQARRLALQRLEDEAERLSQQIRETKDQLSQIGGDRTHEQQTLQENTAILERLEAEEKELLSGGENADQDLQAREETKKQVQSEVDALDETYTSLMEKSAADRARKQSLEQQAAQDRQRRESVRSRLETVKTALQAKKEASSQGDETGRLREEIEALEKSSDTLRQQVSLLGTALDNLRNAREESRKLLNEKQTAKSRLESEISTLESVVKVYSEDSFRPVFEDVRADEGFELALSRALGDTLMASTDAAAPVAWSRTDIDPSSLPALPSEAQNLAPHVHAPAELRCALSQIGFVDTVETGDRIAKQLKPGQSLVSREGAYWRWDGLRVRVQASDRHAEQLKQKNRLAELQKKLPGLETEVEAQRAALEKIEKELSGAQETRTAAERTLRDQDSSHRQKSGELNRAIEKKAGQQAELAKLEEALSLAETDLQTLEQTLEASIKALENFDDGMLEAQQVAIGEARETLNLARERLHVALRDFELSKQENSRRKARLQAIGDERVNLHNRCIRARERLKELDAREQQLTAKAEELQKRPSEVKSESEELLSRIQEAEQEKSVVSDRLATIEAELSDTTKALKEAEAGLSEARESRAHAQATAAERMRHLEEIRNFIQEQFGMPPEELATQAALDDEAMPDLDDLRQQKDRAVRDRDNIGPVNLRADQEAEELEKELGGILSERNDLMQAIEELRQGIQTLNKEARERLNIAFHQINGHFEKMFTRLFSGGKAHLALIESDDPLQAGLEIYAQPPGKALQSLSLLSGGEQTLTATALIFAMFLTNPAPICVLDEVDAPLDDANVDRLCTMLEEFAERGETRFLVITHHRMTMARMDRLYGVTMSERGVSQLVSVDMNQQFSFLEAAE